MAAAIPFIGAGISMMGQLQAGADKQAAYEMEAANKRAQSAQVEIAANREIDITRRRFERVQASQAVAFGRSGVQMGTGSPLAVMEETAATAMDEMLAIRQAADYRKSSLLTEGLYSGILGKQASDAAAMGALGSAFEVVSKNPYTYDTKVKKNKSTGSYSGNYTGDEGSKFGGIA